MPWFDWYFLVGLGGLFIILGVIGFFWAKHEESSYYDNIASRPDVREFLDHLPWRPEPHAIVIGSRIIIVVGFCMLIFGGVYWLWL